MKIYSKLLLMNKPHTVFEETAAGEYQLDLPEGRYEITIISAGGGGAVYRSLATGTCHWVQGGVGGTLQAIVNNYIPNDIKIKIGTGGNSISGVFSGASPTTYTAEAGGDTRIDGIPGATLVAHGGTGAGFRPISTSGGRREVGKMGNNTVSGDAIVQILINNPETVLSNQGTGSGTSRQPVGQSNYNWPADVTRGRSGDGGWQNTNLIIMNGNTGYVRIRRL